MKSDAKLVASSSPMDPKSIPAQIYMMYTMSDDWWIMTITLPLSQRLYICVPIMIEWKAIDSSMMMDWIKYLVLEDEFGLVTSLMSFKSPISKAMIAWSPGNLLAGTSLQVLVGTTFTPAITGWWWWWWWWSWWLLTPARANIRETWSARRVRRKPPKKVRSITNRT